jgi:hypothetical protein
LNRSFGRFPRRKRMRIPAKLNADSEDAERGFRASRTQLGA